MNAIFESVLGSPLAHRRWAVFFKLSCEAALEYRPRVYVQNGATMPRTLANVTVWAMGCGFVLGAHPQAEPPGALPLFFNSLAPCPARRPWVRPGR